MNTAAFGLTAWAPSALVSLQGNFGSRMHMMVSPLARLEADAWSDVHRWANAPLPDEEYVQSGMR